jgi:hypothetical protein
MITREQLSSMKRWYYSSISSAEIMKMSGWKLYIYGETIDDSLEIAVKLLHIAQKYDFTMKVATQHIINRNTNMQERPAWSIGVIYLHAEIFKEKKIRALVDEINESLKDYNRTGMVKGAKSLNGKIHYRYDLMTPVDPAVGVTYEKYTNLYRGEGGDFNIPTNKDIESSLNEKV